MLLLVDIGNTNITLGVAIDGQLARDWRLSSRTNMTADEFWMMLTSLLLPEKIQIEDLAGVAISSVVPSLTPTVQQAVRQRLDIPLVNVTSDLDLGITIAYEKPEDVGADRLCNAVAGYKQYGGPLVIVDFGTATTFDILSASGEYLGGIIAPGPETTTKVLHAVSAKLPAVKLEFPPNVIGRTTETSIQSGLMFGGVSMVDGLNQQLRAELGDDTRIIATGGLAKVFLPHFKTVEAIEPNLTLYGLQLIFERCRPQTK